MISKAISIKQPWAWLIINGIKDVENRTWYSNHRGPLYIHASKNWDQDGYHFLLLKYGIYDSARLPAKKDYVFGSIIGTVNMVDCVSYYQSVWFYGPYGFVFENPFSLIEPMPFKGRLGIFNVPSTRFKK